MHAVLLKFHGELPEDPDSCRAIIRELLTVWCREFATAGSIQKRVLNHGKQNVAYVPDMDGLNYMHVVGMKLCALLDNHTMPMYDEHNIEIDVYSAAPQLRTSTCEIREMDWDQVADLLTALQIEMPNLVFATKDNSTHLKINIKIDVLKVLVMCLKRVGFLTQRYWKVDPAKLPKQKQRKDGPDEDEQEELAEQELTRVNKHGVTEHGWSYIERHNIVQVFDALHALTSVTLAFCDCEIVNDDDPECTAEIIENMTEHHREVSLDRFYEISMISDINPGMIAQYKHRHQEVFHSVSQVVYYNWPSYQRHKQKKFADIMQDRAAVNILPLLAEMFPTIPILYEHDGALSREAHSKHTFSWALINANIFLVTENLKIYYSDDIMRLCSLFQKSSKT